MHEYHLLSSLPKQDQIHTFGLDTENQKRYAFRAVGGIYYEGEIRL